MSIAHAVANRGGAVLLVAHDLNLAAAHADRITLLHHGRNIATGEPWNVLTEPTLTATFGHRVAVTRNPYDDTPLITPLRAKTRVDARLVARSASPNGTGAGA